MSEKKNFTNGTSDFYNFKLLNNSKITHTEISPAFILKKISYYFFLVILTLFILFFLLIIILLIRRQILKFLEKLRRIKLQNEINKIMMIDIFETRSPTIDSGNNEFHSINNDSSLSDISNSSGNNVLSEINVHNNSDTTRKTKDSNDI